MGRLFELMIDIYNKKANSNWDAILNGEEILSEKEANDLIKITSKLRKERGFRNVISH